MAQRNIHGDWSISFEDRILRSQVTGAFNKEGNLAWLENVKSLVLSLQGSNTMPWVAIVDAVGWNMSPPDAAESTNTFIDWMTSSNCLILAIVFSTKIQKFATEERSCGQNIIQIYFDYDEAYQACLDKLAEAQGSVD